MESPITLQYPNGRVHEATLTTSTALMRGYEFELYGRHWKAVRLLELRRGMEHERRRMLCFSTTGLLTPER